MTPSEYTTLLHKLGCDIYTVEKSPKRMLIRIQTAGDRRALLQSLSKYGEYFPKSSYSSVGAVKAGDIWFVVKPIKGATENLHIKASGLASGGLVENLDLFGYEGVLCLTFNSWSSIGCSIMDELYRNENVSNHIRSTIGNYVADFWDKPQKLKWNGNILPTEKNELGKYLGELLIGMLAFRGVVPIVKDPTKFIVPNSSCFSGIDCAIMQYDNKIVPISNKFGQGAKASFFTNLLPKIVANKKRIKKSWALWNVLKAAEMADFDERRAKEIVYNYGVRTTLEISESGIADPYSEVFREIVSGKRNTHQIRLVINGIKARTDKRTIHDYLTAEAGYSSITGFFTRSIAADLNRCPASIEFLKELIAAKDFYQVNLNVPKWLKGEIEYSYVPSGNVSLTLMGDKATLSDITAKQGLVNYKLELDHEKPSSGTS